MATHYWKPSDPEWHLVGVMTKQWTTLRVRAVEREPNQYLVESESLRCPACDKQYGARDVARGKLAVGSRCKVCGEGVLETVWYRVDLSAYRLNGECGCPYFGGTLKREISADPPETWLSCRHRCKHIMAAAALHQLVYSELLERERYRKSPRLRRQEGVGA